MDYINGEIKANEVGKETEMNGQQTIEGELIEHKSAVFTMKGRKAE